MIIKAKVQSSLALAVLFLTGIALAQTDPGVQSGNRGTGSSTLFRLANNPSGILAFFADGQTRFQEVETVSNSANVGLGPRFNSNQCSSCHAQPTLGGTGAATNPQFLFTSNGVAPGNTMPSFITADGPTLEARFPFFFNTNGSVNTNAPNGGVETIFTVTGRSDAGTCNSSTALPQPSFATAVAANNIIFRIPTPVFGAGLIENLDDSTLLKNQLVNLNNNLGISGTFNHNGNDGTISRFVEGTEQVAAHFRRRGVQRRDGHQQLAVPPRSSAARRRWDRRHRRHRTGIHLPEPGRGRLSGRYVQPGIDGPSDSR